MTTLALRDPVLVKLQFARAALAQAQTIQAAKQIADVAAAAKVYARQQHLGQQAIDYAHAVRIEALRRLGEIYKATAKNRGGARAVNALDRSYRCLQCRVLYKQSDGHICKKAPPTLESIGVTKYESALAQRLARLPEKEFEAVRAGTVSLAQVTHEPSVHFSSASPEHYTPQEVLTWVREVFGDVPDLDPCSNDGTPNVQARAHYTAADDGLRRPWGGRVFLNPPYGREIGNWITKFRDEWLRAEVLELIALLPNRPDTAWFNELTANCDDAVYCSLTGRLTFVGSTDPAPFPSLVAYFGPKHDVFASVFWKRGILWVRPPRDFFVDHNP